MPRNNCIIVKLKSQQLIYYVIKFRKKKIFDFKYSQKRILFRESTRICRLLYTGGCTRRIHACLSGAGRRKTDENRSRENAHQS